MKNTIPPMTDPMGRHWNQPDAKDIEIDDTHALMSSLTFAKLSEYSSSLPSGVYPGKMWKRHDGLFDPNSLVSNRRWLLCWFGEVPGDPSKCSINYREIIVT